jgi:hypothetical protein
VVAVRRDGHFCLRMWFRRGSCVGVNKPHGSGIGIVDPGTRRIRRILCMKKEGKGANYWCVYL